MNNVKSKAVLIFLAFLFSGTTVQSQDISGTWNGLLEIQGNSLRIVFHILKSDTGYSATMDSPDQGAKGIPVTTVRFSDSIVDIKVDGIGLNYQGQLSSKDIFSGTLRQGGYAFSMDLSRKELIRERPPRPQEPEPPFPYYTEELRIKNTGDSIELAGTLSRPDKKGRFPVVILISGSGPQNRDEELFNHKPFLVLADYLTRQGIAVLRMDDRGVGESEGDFSTATTFDFARDVQYAIEYLQKRKDIIRNEIGLLGHSEGGIVSLITAANSSDVDFVITLAGPALRGDKLMLLQKYKMEEKMGVGKQVLDHNQKVFSGAYTLILDEDIPEKQLPDSLDVYFKDKIAVLPENQRKQIVNQLSSRWMIRYLRLDPRNYLEKIHCPALALYGSRDLQVPSKENIRVLQEIIEYAPKPDIIYKEFENLNHLFQESSTGLPNEYATIEQSLSPLVLETISTWILQQVN